MPLTLPELKRLVAILDPLDGRPIRLLVTGSRTWSDEDVAHRALELVGWAAIPNQVTLVHGSAGRGLDRIARDWAAPRRPHWMLEPHPAMWADLGRRAGMVRNAEMVKAGASLCCAFINRCPDPACRRPRPHGSHGATGCADLAETAGIPTWRCER